MVATVANLFPNWQPASGIDFSPGKTLGGKDVYKIASPSRYQEILKSGLTGATATVPPVGPAATVPPVGPAATLPPVGSAVPSLKESLETIFEFEKARAPYERQKLIDAAQIQQQLNEQGFASAYPWINQAAETGAARTLRDSKSWREFVERQPTTLQNIAASKQAQMTSAAGAESDRARAIAAQTQAAKDFAGRYSGKYVSVG